MLKNCCADGFGTADGHGADEVQGTLLAPSAGSPSSSPPNGSEGLATSAGRARLRAGHLTAM
jgi:hypothetical protein